MPWSGSRPPAPTAAGGGPYGPFVGREVELTLIRSVVERAVEHSRAHLLTLIGEAGIGKSRLVEEAVVELRRSEEPPAVWVGRCLPYGEGGPYAPLRDLLLRAAAVRAGREPRGDPRPRDGPAPGDPARGQRRADRRAPAVRRRRADRALRRRRRPGDRGRDAWRNLLLAHGGAAAHAARHRGRALGRAGAARADRVGRRRRRAGAARGRVRGARRALREPPGLGLGHAQRDHGHARGARRGRDAPARDGACRDGRSAAERRRPGRWEPVLPRGDPGDERRGRRRPRARDGAGRDRRPPRSARARRQAAPPAGGGRRPELHARAARAAPRRRRPRPDRAGCGTSSNATSSTTAAAAATASSTP